MGLQDRIFDVRSALGEIPGEEGKQLVEDFDQIVAALGDLEARNERLTEIVGSIARGAAAVIEVAEMHLQRTDKGKKR